MNYDHHISTPFKSINIRSNKIGFIALHIGLQSLNLKKKQITIIYLSHITNYKVVYRKRGIPEHHIKKRANRSSILL